MEIPTKVDVEPVKPPVPPIIKVEPKVEDNVTVTERKPEPTPPEVVKPLVEPTP